MFKGGEDMVSFEELLRKHQCSIERYVKFRIGIKEDAEDVLQNVYLTAFNKFEQLNNIDAFKPWVISIARNECNYYFRQKAKLFEIPIDELTENEFSSGRYGIVEMPVNVDALETLNDKDKQILYLYYWKELSQVEISKILNIPVGTVKSRLYTAKKNFKNIYPYHTNNMKGTVSMKKLPEILPEYEIKKSDKAPFLVKCEELMGLSIIPRLNEEVVWGLYDFATKKCNEYSEVRVVGKAEIHGIEGVEILSKRYDIVNEKKSELQYVAQLTQSHCRYLAETHWDNDVKRSFTFLDGEIFMNNWGFGEDNCGNELLIKPKNLILREKNKITVKADKEISDVVGRYDVEINGKTYDTVCNMELGHFNNAIAIEQYIDKNGRTVLWRRFNRDDWVIKRYKKKWSEMLPENERLVINGETYVHWYDCITDYII